ncbi:MAG: sulfotransferase domain-containing protein [Anaerolineae bacterium]
MNNNAPDSLRSSWGLGRALRTLPDGGQAMRWKRVFKRFGQINVEKLIRRGLEGKRKWSQLRQTLHPTTAKLPVFIVGCNRSGTNMVCAAIGKSPHGWAYQESEFSLAFSAYYLRADWIIEELIRRTPAPIVGFGSILDSQFTDDLLSRFAGAKALWVYRRYEDMANSAARMTWGSHLKDLVRWVAHGELDRLGARGRRISADTVRLFSQLYHPDLSLEDSACLYWYMRNQLYFDLNLHLDARVLLVQYEDTALNPEKAFRRVFGFLGFPYDPAIITDVFASSVGKHPCPGINPAIQGVCDALKARLNAHYARTSDWTPEERERLPLATLQTIP